MGKKSLHSEESEEALAAKILLLEEELASLKQSLQAQHAIRELRASATGHHAPDEQDAPAPSVRSQGKPSEGPIFDESWVMETLKFLVKQQRSSSSLQVLAQVGKLLDLREIGLWGWDPHTASVELLNQWAAPDLGDTTRQCLQHPDWLQ